jgi:glycerol uptake facilitator-like aquaporin
MEREGRGMDALSIFMIGLGVFLLILGPCADFYNIARGLIALVACWGLAITLRVYCFGGPRDIRRYRFS